MLSYGALASQVRPLDDKEMVHTRDRFWIDAPMIGSSYRRLRPDGKLRRHHRDGSFPASVGFHKSSPKILSAKNLRNQSARTRMSTQPRKSLPPT
jgi:hypothetical protein